MIDISALEHKFSMHNADLKKSTYTRSFFDRGDEGFFHCDYCCFISEFYSYFQLLLPVTIASSMLAEILTDFGAMSVLLSGQQAGNKKLG